MKKQLFSFLIIFLTFSLFGQDQVTEVCNAPMNLEDNTLEEITRQAEIELIDSTVRAGNKFFDIFNPSSLPSGSSITAVDSLPYGISKIIGNKMYLVCIDKMKWDMTGGYANVVAAIDMPFGCKRIAFQGSNIKINAGGLANQTATKIMLASKVVIPISQKIKLILPNDESNYLEFDCNGYKQVSLKGYFIFDSTLLESDMSMNNAEKLVKGTFEFKGADLSNIMISTSITPFKVKGLDGVSFSVKNATWDGSDFENPVSSILSEVNPNQGSEATLWHGFHLGNVDIALPKGFATKDNSRIIINAHDIIIDKLGVSGFIGVNQTIANPENTALNGWPISINKVEIKLLQNQLAGGSMEGDINIPLVDDNFGYQATLEQKIDSISNEPYLTYKFGIDVSGEHNSAALKSTLTLNDNSWITIEKDGEQFIPSAKLTGKLSVNNGLIKNININFQDLTIISEKPYVTDGTFGIDSTFSSPKLSGFRVYIEDIVGAISEGSPSLSFTGGINFMGGQDANGAGGMTLSAELGFNIQTKIDTSSHSTANSNSELWKEKPQIEHKGIYVNEVNIDFHHGEFSLLGHVKFFRDNPKYGNGFLGTLGLTIPSLGLIEAAAWFGNIPDQYRYWNVAVGVPITIPVFPPFSINKLYGGLYHHMKPTGLDSASIANLEPGAVNILNMDYEPDQNYNIGFKAGIGFHVATKSAASGNAIFEIGFTSSNGFDYLKINGDVTVLPVDSGQVPIGTIKGYLAMVYSRPLNTIHAVADVIIKLPGITGVGTGGRAGRITFHRDPDNWYLYIGRPITEQYCGLNFANIASATAYLQVGTTIDNIPPLPAELLSIFGTPTNTRNYAQLNTGAGFSFGAHLSSGFNKEWGKIKLGISAGLGLDFMVRNYPDGFTCNGYGSYNGTNGWYAQGQIYAYLTGSLSYDRWEILSLQAGALLKGGFLKPNWIAGKVGARYRLLGGLIHGSVKASFVIGDQCTPSGQIDADDESLIKTTWPEDNDDGYKCRRVPKVWTNFKINQQFSREINGVYKTFILRISDIKHFSSSENFPIIPTVYDDYKVYLAHDASDYGKDDMIQFEMTFRLFEVVNGVETPALDESGIPIVEKSHVKFTTQKNFCHTAGQGLNKWNFED
jgi:hypothetical protein